MRTRCSRPWLATATGLLFLSFSTWLLLAAPAREQAQPSPFTFLRFVDAGPEGTALETAHAVYQDPAGAEVHLLAGFPYGDPIYYQHLREALGSCDAVLHHRVSSRVGPDAGLADRILGLGYRIQDSLYATLLGLAWLVAWDLRVEDPGPGADPRNDHPGWHPR